MTKPTTTLPSAEEDLRALFVASARCEEQVRSLEELVKTLDGTNQRALQVFNSSLEAWKESANEWRASLNDLSSRKIDRTELDTVLKNITDKADQSMRMITDLQQRVGVGGGEKIGADKRTQNIYAALAAFGTLFGIIALGIGVLLAARP